MSINIVGNKLAKDLSLKMEGKFCEVLFKKFSDGTVKPRILNFNKADFGVLIMDMEHDFDINDYVINFLLLSARMKETCKKVIGVIPYLPYNRQDKEFLKGEPVSAKIIGRHLGLDLDYFITCNNHNHRLDLKDLFKIPNLDISLFEDLGKCFSEFDVLNTLVIGPDEESKEFVLDFIKNKKFDYVICKKVRNLDTNKVSIGFPKSFKMEKLKGKDIIIVDDVIATGGTLLKLIPIIQKFSVKSLNFGFVHGLLIGDTKKSLKETQAKKIISSNTIFNVFGKVNCIDSISLAIKKILNNQHGK